MTKNKTENKTVALNFGENVTLARSPDAIQVQSIRKAYVDQLLPGRGEVGDPDVLTDDEWILGRLVESGDIVIRDQNLNIRIAYEVNVWLGLGNPMPQISLPTVPIRKSNIWTGLGNPMAAWAKNLPQIFTD